MLNLLSLFKDLKVPASEPSLLIVPMNKETQGTIDYQLDCSQLH
ncbi:hypothetical protein [Pradoshia eiseniae]|nr:hypothetical protein [Pradoshia eiseniae]